jgi:hypothetical protein
MVCAVVPVATVPVPFSTMVCAALVTLLSLNVSEPAAVDGMKGVKLITAVQVPGASACASEELGVNCGQVELLLNPKFAEMLGLFPILVTGKLRFSLPIFCSSSVCELVLPTLVAGKFRLGGVATGISFTALLLRSAT